MHQGLKAGPCTAAQTFNICAHCWTTCWDTREQVGLTNTSHDTSRVLYTQQRKLGPESYMLRMPVKTACHAPLVLQNVLAGQRSNKENTQTSQTLLLLHCQPLARCDVQGASLAKRGTYCPAPAVPKSSAETSAAVVDYSASSSHTNRITIVIHCHFGKHRIEHGDRAGPTRQQRRRAVRAPRACVMSFTAMAPCWFFKQRPE